MLVTLFGMVMEVSLEHLLKVSSPMLVNPVKYCSSLKEVISEFEEKTWSRLVTAAASA